MLSMVIERFKNADPKPIGERFRQSGRMLPDGLTYHASWVDVMGSRCFQVMEAAERSLLNAWIARWDDLIDFEIVPVLASADFWAQQAHRD
jgi:Domain of unknown function (DUF3303)